MILTVDVGNTHVSFGCAEEGGNIRKIMRISTELRETSDSYAMKISSILSMHGYSLTEINSAVLSSVVPPVSDTLVSALELIGINDILRVGAGVKTGLKIAIDDPGTVASDLVATAVAAKEKYPLPCIVVDMGTATTVSLIDNNGAFRGCAIMPGVGISLDALARRTSLLPLVDLSAPRRVIGRNTAECMRSGVLYGAAAAVDGMIDRFEAEFGESPASIVCTGGDARAVCDFLRREVIYDETLLLYGLYAIRQKNNKNK